MSDDIKDAVHGVEKELENVSLSSKDIYYRYDDEIKITDYATSFNSNNQNSKPDLRNIKYKTSTEHLNCPVCQQPFLEPLTTICGHTFCKSCIYECFKAFNGDINDGLKGSCPLDRTPLDASNVNDLFPTPLLVTNLIDDLQVYCLNHERGCKWNGCRWELEHHVISDCGYTGVHCNGKRYIKKNNNKENNENGDGDGEYDGEYDNEEICTLTVERRFLSDNETECIHKVFQCEYCNADLTKMSEEVHLSNECLYNYQTCELCLNDMIALKNLNKHKENCSKIRYFRCPAHEIGCNWIGNNEPALEIHVQKNNCQLNQLLPYINTLNEKIDSVSTENNFLQKQINKILSLIIQGKITNLGYNEPIEEINKYNSSIASLEDQDKLIYLNYEIDRLKFEMEEKIIPFIKRENSSLTDRKSIMNGLVNDNFMMKDDLSLQRVLINSLRKQLQFLLFTRNSRNMNGSTLNSGMDSENLDLFDMPSRNNSEERLNLKL